MVIPIALDDPLRDKVIKFQRADLHLVALDTEVARFGERNPYGLTYDYNADKTECTVRVVVHEEPHPEWGAVVGDIVHNLRSILDQFVWTLTAMNQTFPSRSTAFPIFLTSNEFRRRENDMIGGLSDDAKTLIEGLQPYHGREEPRSHPLWLLQELWNADKHRVLPIAVTVHRTTDYEIVEAPKGIRIVEQELGPFGVVENGAKIAWFRLLRDAPNAQMQVRLHVTLEVTFGEGISAAGQPLPTAGKRLIVSLSEMRQAVAEVGTWLEPLFRGFSLKEILVINPAFRGASESSQERD